MVAGISIDWRDDIPIWKQIKDKILSQIIDGTLRAGEAAPSVRTLALELAVNPLTVSRALSELADEGILEKRRGLGMFVIEGADNALLKREREAFINNEWPIIAERIKRLGLDLKTLMKTGGSND